MRKRDHETKAQIIEMVDAEYDDHQLAAADHRHHADYQRFCRGQTAGADEPDREHDDGESSGDLQSPAE